MFGRKSDLEKRADSARADLTAARTKLTEINAGEDQAAAATESYTAWRTTRETALSEVQRLTRLVISLEAGDEAQRQNAADEALRKRAADARKRNETLARRIREDGARLVREIKALLRDAAAAELDDREINKMLPPEINQIIGANFLARVVARVKGGPAKLHPWPNRTGRGNTRASSCVDATSRWSSNRGRSFFIRKTSRSRRTSTSGTTPS